MAEEINPALLADVKSVIGSLIEKPRMTDKVLGKPPFRFLHDVISSITTRTGFGEGLYTPQEMDHATITSKEEKLAYLNKIFALVGLCIGRPLEVRAIKVVQGLEVELTNQFLLALGQCAANPSLDSAEAVRLTLQGVEPGTVSPPTRRGGGPPPAESKGEPAYEMGGGAKHEPLDAKIPMDQLAPERGKSRGGTRGGKPQQQSSDVGLTSVMDHNLAPRLDAEIERCDGTEVRTQELLGAVIRRPKLTEKLLGKPPFKFLFDIVMEVMNTTGFGTGLYTPDEMDSSLITEKAAKMAFLEKIIRLVGVQLSTIVEAKPAKIVAGLDAANTNTFLQLLAVAVTHVPDSTNAVRTVLEQFHEGGSTTSAPVAAPAPAPVVTPTPAAIPSRHTDERIVDEPPRRSRPEPSEPKESLASPEDKSFPPMDDRQMIAGGDEMGMEEGDDDKRLARPTTARRRPPKVKEGAKEIASKDVAATSRSRTTGIIRDGENADESDDEIPGEIPSRLGDNQDAKDDGGPQSKLVQDIRSRQAEQEALARGRVETVNETKNEANSQSGTGIRLGKLKSTDRRSNSTGSSMSFGEADMERMRGSIQSLVQQTGPLGTCMDFIQEDISLMASELHRWEEECRREESAFEDAKRQTKEKLHPLRQQLADLEDQIAEQIAKISATKAATARNENTIEALLKRVATA